MEILLNDDCLMYIFQLLDIPDQLRVIETSEYFKSLVIDGIWSRKYRNVHSEMKCLQAMPLSDYRKFFQLNAYNIRILHIEDTKRYAFTSYLNRFTGRPDLAFYFSLNLSNLKELYCHDQRLHDGYIQMLGKYCPNLEILHTESQHVTDAYIKNFPNIREVKMAEKYLEIGKRSYVNKYVEEAKYIC